MQLIGFRPAGRTRLRSRGWGLRPLSRGLALPALLLGLSATPSLGGASALAQVASGSSGRIRGFVFRSNGLPLRDTRVIIAGATAARTDAEGMFVVEREPGPILLDFAPPGRDVLTLERPIPVVAGQETELILTIPDVGAPVLDLEVPERAIESRTETDVAKGTVRGLVLSEQKGEPVVGARVFIRGSRADARTDGSGRFEIELPEGRRELTVIHPGFSTATVPVEVAAGEAREAEIRLAEKSLELAEVVIVAPKIQGSTLEVLKERQDSASVADVLGADQISKAGDSDAAGALSRVTGITVVGGRYIYVRGLGERYSATQLNQSNLPSPDPERRVVPLDLFPASAIAAITVQKTYSPNLPAEFGGGLVQIRTREIPEEFELNVGLSGRWVTNSTLETGLGYPGTDSDFLGFGAAGRELPPDFRALADRTLIRRGNMFTPGLTPVELERLGEQLPNVYAGTDETLLPDFGLSIDGGGKFDLLGAKAGVLLSADYSNQRFLQRGQFNLRATRDDGRLPATRDYDVEETQNEIGLSGLGSFALDFGEQHQFRLTSGVFRISTDRTQFTSGFEEDAGGLVEIHILDWTERMVNTNQVRGSHVLVPGVGLKLDWRYQLSIATSDQPNRRALRRFQQGGVFQTTNDSHERFFSDLDDQGHQAEADLTLPVPIFGAVTSTFQVGFGYEQRNREVQVRRYGFRRTGTDAESSALRGLPPNSIFREDTIGPNGFEIEETTRGDDNYEADQTLIAGYGQVDLGILDNLKVLLGARVESSDQGVEVQTALGEAAGDDPALSPSLVRLDVLPAATLTWEFIEDMQLRLAYAQTVNRPNFRELSPGAFIDQTRSLEFRGNPDLERAQLEHIDLRWEWYPSPGESLSLAGFFKDIDDPIENSLQLGSNPVARPINTRKATNFGAELEGRKNLGFIVEELEDLYVAGNFTLVSSEVDLGDAGGVLTSSRRPLQGQSPYALNAQIGYDNVDVGFSGTVLFNVFGPRISDVGLLGVPDVYEQPRPTLDLVLKQSVDRFGFTLKVQNLIDAPVKFTQEEPATGDLLTRERYLLGRRISLSMSVDLN